MDIAKPDLGTNQTYSSEILRGINRKKIFDSKFNYILDSYKTIQKYFLKIEALADKDIDDFKPLKNLKNEC